MKINLEFLENYYKNIDKEDKEKNNITCFEDFRGYIAGLLISNLEYDFGYNVYYDDIFEEE